MLMLALAIRGVLVVMGDRRQINDLPVAYAPFGNDVIGELLHVGAASFQDRHLHAAFVIQVNVQRSLREVMMIVEIAR